MSVDSIQRLKAREKQYIENRCVHGMNRTQSALSAGYSAQMANHATERIERTRRISDVMQMLARLAVPIHKIAHVLAEGLDATHSNFITLTTTDKKTGKPRPVIVEKKSPDFKERREMAKVAMGVAGYYSEKPRPEDEADQGGDNMPPERLGRLLAKALQLASEENGGAKVGIAMTYEKHDDPEEVERANSAWDRSVNG